MSDQTPEPVAHARAAAEAIRAINHLTVFGDGGLTHPSGLSDVLHALAQVADRLPQTLTQLARITGKVGERDDLYDDRGSWHDPATTCETVDRDLRTASLLGSFADELRTASGDLSHLAVVDDA